MVCNLCLNKTVYRNTSLARDMNRHFSKEDIQMANKHKRKCLTTSAIKEMQIKTTRYYFTSTGIAIVLILKKKIISVGNNVEKSENLYIAGRNAK